MSTQDWTETHDSTRLHELPQFDLSFLYDDQSNPSEVTVFMSDHDETLATHWITIDTDSAIPLDEVL